MICCTPCFVHIYSIVACIELLSDLRALFNPGFAVALPCHSGAAICLRQRFVALVELGMLLLATIS